MDEPSPWPPETTEVRSQRLLEAVDQTRILDWTPEQRQALKPTVVDFLARDDASKEALRKRADRAARLVRSLQIWGVVIAALALLGPFVSFWLATHVQTAPVVVYVTPSPSPTRHP